MREQQAEQRRAGPRRAGRPGASSRRPARVRPRGRRRGRRVRCGDGAGLAGRVGLWRRAVAASGPCAGVVWAGPVADLCAAVASGAVGSARERRRAAGRRDREHRAARAGWLTSTRPPCASTTAATMARPRPVLPAAREREVSPRANRSKTSGCRSVRDARAVVGDGRRPHRPVVAARPRGDRACPAGCGCGRWPAGWPAPGAAGRRRRARSTGSSGRSSRQRWSRPAAWASLTASTTSRDRSTGSLASGRPESSRASSSRSSTSVVIRALSDSTRPSAWATSGGTASRPRRVSSA